MFSIKCINQLYAVREKYKSKIGHKSAGVIYGNIEKHYMIDSLGDSTESEMMKQLDRDIIGEWIWMPSKQFDIRNVEKQSELLKDHVKLFITLSTIGVWIYDNDGTELIFEMWQ